MLGEINRDEMEVVSRAPQLMDGHLPSAAAALPSRTYQDQTLECASCSIAPRLATDVVVLVPGFLGFSRFSTFYYFADRVSAAIRGALEAERHRSVPVVSVTTAASRSLEQRQSVLIRTLERLAVQMPGVRRFHLVGHSTGGVDAQLILRSAPLKVGSAWTRQQEKLRRMVASVATIAAPHYGTSLVEQPAVREFRKQVIGPHFLAKALQMLPSVGSEIADNAIGGELIAGLLGAPRDAIAYMWDVLRHRELISDLDPSRMARLRHSHAPDVDTPVTCFVTIAPSTGTDVAPGRRSLFRSFQCMTAEVRSTPAREVTHALELLGSPRLPLISDHFTPTVDLSSNDGIVNTSRQLLVDLRDNARLGAVVVADHLDVVGQYDRIDPMTNRDITYGLFDSGARFGDDQFFALYRSVASSIAEAIACHSRAS